MVAVAMTSSQAKTDLAALATLAIPRLRATPALGCATLFMRLRLAHGLLRPRKHFRNRRSPSTISAVAIPPYPNTTPAFGCSPTDSRASV
jgi:hypothetical protein